MNNKQTTAKYEIEYTLRSDFRTNTLNKEQSISVLDKFIEEGVLKVLPNTELSTTKHLADFFKVGTSAIKYHITDEEHKQELFTDGFELVRGKDLVSQYNCPTKKGVKGRYVLTTGDELAYNLNAVFTKRAVLRMAMMLEKSEVAKEIRTLLLDMEKAYATGKKLGFDSEEFKFVDGKFEDVMTNLIVELNQESADRHNSFSSRIRFEMERKQAGLGDIEKYNVLFKEDNYLNAKGDLMKLRRNSKCDTVFYAVFNYLMFKETGLKLGRKSDIRQTIKDNMKPHLWSEYDKIYTWVDNHFEILEEHGLPYPNTVELAEKCFASMKRQDIFKMFMNVA